ncbi:MAG: HAD family phosphatase [Pirellulales bacterium]|nr:HAD family phosphatase [Pirellulales bacterium]
MHAFDSSSTAGSCDIRAVVFDLDGLMFNTEEIYQEVGSTLLGRRGKRFEPDLRDAMMGRPPRVALQIMIDHHQLDIDVDALAAESSETFMGLLDDRIAPMPGLIRLMESLEAAEIPKAIATSSSRWFVDHVLRMFEYHTRFQFVLSSDDVTNGKPHPEVYLSAAKRFGIAPAEMLVLEDSENGCRAAAAAGAFTVAVPCGASMGHDVSMATLVINSLADVALYQRLRLPCE